MISGAAQSQTLPQHGNASLQVDPELLIGSDLPGLSDSAISVWLGRGTGAAHPIIAIKRWDNPCHRLAGVLE
jgi:hypothetical protein